MSSNIEIKKIELKLIAIGSDESVAMAKKDIENLISDINRSYKEFIKIYHKFADSTADIFDLEKGSK